MEWLMPASVDAVQGWILYAFQHGVKSLSMDLRLPDLSNLGDIYFYCDEGKQGEVGAETGGGWGGSSPLPLPNPWIPPKCLGWTHP